MRIQDFDTSADLTLAILWQYSQATNLLSLINQKQDWYNTNQEDFWDNWYINVFNLQTANFFGLSVWAYILNLPLFIPLHPENPDKPNFGFNEVITFPTYINTYLNFTVSNFSTRGGEIILTLEEQRFILRLRYYQLANRGAIPEINAFLNYLCSTSTGIGGNITVLDNFDMTITYVFYFQPSFGLKQVLQQYDLLPRPAGVGIKYIVITDTIFGFNQRLSNSPIENLNIYQNFENGDFIPESF